MKNLSGMIGSIKKIKTVNTTVLKPFFIFFNLDYINVLSFE